ncbi:hypothetical protein P7F60_12160 [Rhizobium sp. YJ-22]|uniref:hypothetical protein n=1 Tax=Rhizobium sp. YJ-22 TaxID=3037556 RepID=UPI002412976B|nr:hypothetical protein [Rhizobium sp. YJ-22]MDG3577146.1 hypothetical protein [Rhizobium sp. YJ-22]
MTPFIDIKPGQWVIAFYGSYFFPGSDMGEWLERFVSRGGGWDNARATDIFSIHMVEAVRPKTYLADGGLRFSRDRIVAALESNADAVILRDRFFAIGHSADDQIDFAVDRLARPVRRRVYAKALKEIHEILPHIFKSEGSSK